jgi:hypothetical protein
MLKRHPDSESAGKGELQVTERYNRTSLVGFAFTDAAAMAKVFSDLVKNEPLNKRRLFR